MSTAFRAYPHARLTSDHAAAGPGGGRPLHRLAEVRRREGLSRRAVARRMKISVREVARQEEATFDMPLSRLYEWQRALDVPVTELLAETDLPLSRPVKQRSQLLRIMKTAVTILQRARQPAIRRMAQTLVDQLLELMPELEGVGPWPSVGRRRRSNELGQTAYRQLPSHLAISLESSE